jgi:LPXTG-motif cell wall-anchored protein
MSYNQPFRPQIYSYQSRSRFRQYPRQVVTSIPGAGFAVDRLQWGDQAIDLGGLGVVVGPPARSEWSRWWELTPAFFTAAAPAGFDDYPQRSQVEESEAAGSPVFFHAVRDEKGSVISTSAKWINRGGTPVEAVLGVPASHVASGTLSLNAVSALRIPTLSREEVDARLERLRPPTPGSQIPDHTASYIVGIGAVVLLGGGGYYLWKRGKKAV